MVSHNVAITYFDGLFRCVRVLCVGGPRRRGTTARAQGATVYAVIFVGIVSESAALACPRIGELAHLYRASWVEPGTLLKNTAEVGQIRWQRIY